MQRRRSIRPAHLLSFVLAVSSAAGCGSNSGPGAPQGGALAGTRWVLTSFGGNEDAPDDLEYDLHFVSDSEFVSTDDCNTIAGQYAAEEDGSFSIHDGVTSLVECPPGSQYMVFAARLYAAADYPRSESELVLASPEGELVFELSSSP
jgi:heat shock protein HslJ